MNNNKYHEMAEVFGAEFEEDTETVEHVPTRTFADISETLPAIINDDEEKKVIEDEAYIKNQFRMGVEMSNDVAEVLRENLQQGAKASEFEAFSSIMRERRETLVALQNLNTKTYEMNHSSTSNGSAGGGNTTNNMVFTSTDAIDMILQARDGLHPNDEVK
jgi:hypothetical protein